MSRSSLAAEIHAHVRKLQTHRGGTELEDPGTEADVYLLRGIAALLSRDEAPHSAGATGMNDSALVTEIETQVDALQENPSGMGLEGPGIDAKVLALRGIAALLRTD